MAYYRHGGSAKALARWNADPRVREAWTEEDGWGPDGWAYWIEMHDGWINTYSGTHSIHEPTVKECEAQLKYNIKSCDCEDCLKAL